MRWSRERRSTNVEDYRGRRMGGAGVKLGAGALVVALLGWFFGIDPRLIFGLMEGVQTTQVEPPPPGGVQETGSASDELAHFMSSAVIKARLRSLLRDPDASTSGWRPISAPAAETFSTMASCHSGTSE